MPTPDAEGNIAMSGTEAKVRLLGRDNEVVDLVGYGGANEYEGEAAPKTSNTQSIARIPSWKDTNNNKQDFEAQGPNPRNSTISEKPDGGNGDLENQPLQVKSSVASGSTVEVGTQVKFTTTTPAQLYVDLNDSGYRMGEDTYTVTLNDGDFTGIPATAMVKVYACNEEETTELQTFTYIKKEASGFVSIEEARAASVGTIVTVEGIVTRAIQSSGTNTTNCTLFIQDDTAGIGVYVSGIKIDTYLVGQKVSVTGTTGTNYGMVQIKPASSSDIKIISEETAPRESEIITIEKLNTRDYDGKFVKIENVKLNTIHDKSNHIIEDENTNATTTMRCTDGLTLPSELFEEGDVISVVGIASNNNGTPQLLVSKVEDITKGIKAPVATVTATPDNGSQVPFEGGVTLTTAPEGATISYSLNGKTK